jgi:hypothetical protein
MNKIPFNQLNVGMIAKDNTGYIWVVYNIIDIHNIHVKFIIGSNALFCLDENCEEYDPLYYL